jgi:hypothetical protein
MQDRMAKDPATKPREAPLVRTGWVTMAVVGIAVAATVRFIQGRR